MTEAVRRIRDETNDSLRVIPTRHLLLLFFDKMMARMPTTTPCRDETRDLRGATSDLKTLKQREQTRGEKAERQS